MIRDLKSLAIFDAVIKHNGFSKAAIALKMTPTGVSQHISKLEDQLGVTLMYRSTRSFSLTDKGQIVANMAAKMMRNVEDGYAALYQENVKLSGKIRVSIPSFSTEKDLMPAIWNFADLHQSVDIQMHVSDRPVDLIRDGFDVAIRYGSIYDANLKARKIGTFNVVTVCHRDYLQTRPKPTTPHDLTKLDYISLGAKLKSNKFVRDNKTIVFSPINERIETNSADQTYNAIQSGLGYSHLPEFICQNGLESGEIVRLIPDWHIPTLGIYALRPKDARSTDLSAKFVQHLIDYKIQPSSSA